MDNLRAKEVEDDGAWPGGYTRPMPLRRFFSSARDKRTLLYCLSLLLDILCLFAGYIVALQLRDEQWLAAGGHSIIYIALPIFIMFEIAREAQDVETLANRLTAIQRSLGALGATAIGESSGILS